MKTYSFTVKCEGVETVTDEVVNLIYSRCDDGSIHSQGDNLYVSFDREAELLDDALKSAIHDVQSVEGLKVVQIVMDSDELTKFVQNS